MTSTNYGRHSPGVMQNKRDLPPLSSRPKSSAAAHALDNKHTFLKYKPENRATEDESTVKTNPTTVRDQRRKSKMNVPSSARKESAISSKQTHQTNMNYGSDNQDNALPLKIFDGTKKAISDVSEQSRSYFWIRRIKEIFLQMGTNEGVFVDFDMSLARADMLAACDVYVRNDSSKLKKKGGAGSDDSEERGLVQKIEESLKQLRNTEALLADKNSSSDVIANLQTSTAQLISNIQLLERGVKDVVSHLQKPVDSKDTIDAIRKSLRSLPKEIKSQLKMRQEWNLQKLYSEIFKTSYRRNELRTLAQKAELKPEKKGSEEPNFGNAIWWYSCNEASIYYQINSILKLENFELLMAYRYYLSDLCKMIEYIYNNESAQGSERPKYYRAASISRDRLEQMKKTIEEKKKGQVISMGGFTSTTTELKMAKQYARTQSLSSGNVRVLFEITVKPDKPCTAHAFIGNISFHPEEVETLFSMGSTFSVDKIDAPGSSNIESSKDEATGNNDSKDEINYYTVHLTACDVDKALLDDMRAKVQECSPSQLSVLLARYMLELGEYRVARKYLTELCRESDGILKDDSALPSIFNCLGMTFHRQNLYADAVVYYKKALDCQARIGYSDNNALAEIHNNIGLSYIGLKLMEEAQATLEEAERIQLREPATTRFHIAPIYANIGYVHYARKGPERDLQESENYFEKAVRIYQKATSKITHDAIERALLKAECYTNYGHLLSAKKNDNAQERYNEALKIYKSILPDGDPKLMRAYMNIMMEHAHHQNYEKVIELYEDETLNDLINRQANNLFASDKTVTVEDLIVLIQVVGACYVQHKAQFFQAIRAWTRAYELQRKAKLVQLLLPTDTAFLQWSRKLVDATYHKAYLYFTSDKVEMPKNDENTQEPKRASSARAKSAKPKEQTWPSICFSRGFMCYKRNEYKNAIKYFDEAIKENENLHVRLLVAEIFEVMSDFKRAENEYTNSLKKFQSMNDQPLLIEISLARINSLDEDSKAIEDLKQLDSTLSANDADITRISLKAIVCDMIAYYYLKLNKYSTAINYANKNSIPLKMRSLSHYHPSLAKNHLLLAEACISSEEYSNAIKYFENAVEIQRLNLASDHLDIKHVYYKMGDVYCMMNRIDLACEKYEFAESDISENDSDENTNTDNGYDEKRLSARASMNQHLAAAYARRAGLDTAELEARKADWTTAIEKHSSSIEILEELYPFDVKIEPVDIPIMVDRLKKMALYNERLADSMALNKHDDTENIYKKALAIQAKLIRYININQGEIYRKRGRFYEQIQDDKETAITLYQEAVDESLDSAAAITTYYKLARLAEEWKEDSELATNFYNKAYKCIDKGDTILKSIFQEKCPKIEETNSSESDDQVIQESDENNQDTNENDDQELEESAENENNQEAIKSNENTSKPSEEVDDNAVHKKAEAYERLDDTEAVIKYCQNFIEENSNSDIELNVEVPDYSEVECDQQIYAKILVEILCACAEHIRPYEIFDDEKIMVRKLADAHLHWAHGLKRNEEYDDAIEKYLKSFSLSRQCLGTTEANAKLIEFVEKLTKNEFSNLNALISAYVQISPLDGTRLWLQVAAAYRHSDFEGDDSSDPVDMAIEACSEALKTAIEFTPTLKFACHYAMLRIYKDLRYADKQGRTFIEQIAKEEAYGKRSKSLSAFDQRLLSQWIHDFIKEYNDEAEAEDDGEIPSELVDKFFIPSREDAMMEEYDSSRCLGDILISINDFEGAVAYWEWTLSECESFYSKSIKLLIYDEDKTFGEVFHGIHQLQSNAYKFMMRLVSSHEQLARYYMDAVERTDLSAGEAVDYFENASSECENAIKLRREMSGNLKPENADLQDLLEKIKKKLKEAEEKYAKEEGDSDDDDDADDDDSEVDEDDSDEEENDNED